MRWGFLVLAWALVAAPAIAAPMLIWDRQKDHDGKVYTIDGVRLTFHARRHQRGTPAVDIHMDGVPDKTVEGMQDSGAGRVVMHFAVGRFDPQNRFAQILVVSSSGGAGCCFYTMLIERGDKGWNTVGLSFQYGAVPERAPADIDGDKIADFRMRDVRFPGIFESGTADWEPPRIFNIIGGEVVDVSAQWRYRAYFRDDQYNAEDGCLKHSRAACAGYMADAARLGQGDKAWNFVLAHYDRKADWPPPQLCDHRPPGIACGGQTILSRDFPKSLAAWLKYIGYVH